MNENIRKLAKEVGLLESSTPPWSCAPVEPATFTDTTVEEFAELLVEECCEQARDEVHVVARIRQHFGLWK